MKELENQEFLDLSEKTTIPQLAALISRFKAFITTDTGPMHFAYALRIPTIALFYHHVAQKWGPKYYDINRVIYGQNMETIQAERVIQEFIRRGIKPAHL